MAREIDDLLDEIEVKMMDEPKKEDRSYSVRKNNDRVYSETIVVDGNNTSKCKLEDRSKLAEKTSLRNRSGGTNFTSLLLVLALILIFTSF